jgi:hypothetical protein
MYRLSSSVGLTPWALKKRRINLKTEIRKYSDDDIYFWIENDSSLMIKAITKFGDPVELGEEEAIEFANKLQEYAYKLKNDYENINEEFVKIDIGISTADAEYPNINKFDSNGNLILQFKDWTGKIIEIAFFNACGFVWNENIDTKNNERDDSIYEIKNSKWIKKYYEDKIRSEKDNLKHFKLNFNACGSFEIIFETYKINPTTAST